MSNKGLGKALTNELIFTKTKSDSLHNIKNINLWGNDLEDLSLLQKMINIQVISLSVNCISSLKYFNSCHKLQELYLRKNNISDLREIKYLVKLPFLKVLWLNDNPCAEVIQSVIKVQNYREIVIKYLPNLVKLDNNPITAIEKANSLKVNYILGIEEHYKSQKSQNNQSYNPQYRNSLQNSSQKQQRNIRQSGSSKKRENRSEVIQREQRFSPYQNNDNNEKKNKKILKKINYLNCQKQVSIAEINMNRNQNILMAVLSLMRELDNDSLQIVKREAQKKIQ